MNDATETKPPGPAPTLLPTDNLNVEAAVSLPTPREFKDTLPQTPKTNQTVVNARETIKRILGGVDDRLLVTVGPCSIHDEQTALEYAERLAKLAEKVSRRMMIVMRVYFEKPRTVTGWKGLINDPHLNDTFDMETGLATARRILLAINEMGLPAATEILEAVTPQYIADLISWTAIGARTTESQTHRQMASGLSMPVGYKNSTEGNIQIALDGMRSSRAPHSFLGVDADGRTVIIKTRGNPWGHLILRGGRGRPNYDRDSVNAAVKQMPDLALPPAVMVDCSHANCSKQYEHQEIVLRDAIEQRRDGQRAIIGVMIESNLNEGNQKLAGDPADLKYGVSITDACIGWDKTEELLLWTADALG